MAAALRLLRVALAALYAPLLRLVRAGAWRHADPRVARRVVITNAIALVAALVALGNLQICVPLHVAPLVLASIVAVAIVCGLCVWMNARGWFTTARVVFLCSAIFTMTNFRFALNLRFDPALFYALACVPLLISDLKERRLIIFGVGITIGSILWVKLVGEAHMGPSLFSEAELHRFTLAQIPLTFVLLLASVLSFMVTSNRAEKKLEISHAAVQTLLDSVDQGFVTLDRAGKLMTERSAIFDEWFAKPAAGTPFMDCLARVTPITAELFQMAWSQIDDAFLPLELLIDQLPVKTEMNGRYFSLAYRPELDEAGQLKNLLVVMTDVTPAIERERALASQQDLLSLMERFSGDHHSFREFMSEADRLIEVVLTPQLGHAELTRAVHTLKGTCGLFGARTIAHLCHDLENGLTKGEDSAVGCADLGTAWHALKGRMRVFHGAEVNADILSVERRELDQLRLRLRANAPAAELLSIVDALTWEPAEKRLALVRDQITALAERLGKVKVDVEIDAGGLRFEPTRWATFWSSFAHVVRNSVDHGLETPDERAQSGKPDHARVVVHTRLEQRQLLVDFSDDGRGVDWAAVAHKGNQRGVDTSSREALGRALFLDGLSTRDEVTETSGRGVGLAAVREACAALQGTIEVDSELGKGARFRFRFPAAPGVIGSPLAPLERAASRAA